MKVLIMLDFRYPDEPPEAIDAHAQREFEFEVQPEIDQEEFFSPELTLVMTSVNKIWWSLNPVSGQARLIAHLSRVEIDPKKFDSAYDAMIMLRSLGWTVSGM